MKKLLLPVLIALASLPCAAQQLAPDQNPAYKVSADKYKAAQEKTPDNMNTTVQNTYKAYDFRVAKEEKKAARREENRRERYYSYNRFGYGAPYQNYNNYYSPYPYPSYYGYRRW